MRGIYAKKTKNFILAITCMLIMGSIGILFPSFGESTTIQNAVKNAGFENALSNSDWIWEANGVTFETIPTIASSYKYNGEYALGGGTGTTVSDAANKKQSWYYQDIDLEGSDEHFDNEIITFSAFINAIDGINGDKGFLKMDFLNQDKDVIGTGIESEKVADTNGFEKVSITANVPKNSKYARVYLVFSIEMATGLEVYFDDASVNLNYSTADVIFKDGDEVICTYENIKRGSIFNSTIPNVQKKNGLTFKNWVDEKGNIYKPNRVINKKDVIYYASYNNIVKSEIPNKSTKLFENSEIFDKEKNAEMESIDGIKISDTINEKNPGKQAKNNYDNKKSGKSKNKPFEGQKVDVIAIGIFVVAGVAAVIFIKSIASDLKILKWFKRKKSM